MLKSIHVSRIQCQKFAHGKGQCKGKLKCFKCSWEDHEGCDCNNNPKCSNCGQPHMASSKNCHYFLQEKEVQKVKSENNIPWGVQKSYVSVAKRVFISVEAMFTWIENTEKPTRLTVKPKEKNCNTITLSIKFFSDSQPFSSNFNYFYKFN